MAKGRVWTGEDALAHGLVDALGGLQDALRLAKQEAGLPLQARRGSAHCTVPRCAGHSVSGYAAKGSCPSRMPGHMRCMFCRHWEHVIL